MNIFIPFIALFLSLNVFAAYDKPADARFKLNSSSLGSKVQLGDLVVDKKVHILRAQYDFAVGGGAVSTINMKDMDGKDAKIPDNAIVVDCVIDVLTAPTDAGATATIAIGTGQAGNDLKAATAIASYTGLVACVPVGSAATMIKMTAERTPSVTIAGEALTAGKLDVLVQYILSE
jgi:hypothetical protein